ncbi:MAG: hypothetical protein LBN05_08400 [Oscillospiraceae bacterium]|jgi:hypothetical protein|nr:hypothetical protein [Oscillospiraceae bacterium]
MTLQEANDRLKKAKISEGQLWALIPLYLTLDLHKDDFCKIIDAVGLDTLLSRSGRWERLAKADADFTTKECYLRARARLQEIDREREELAEIINRYVEERDLRNLNPVS